MEILLKVGRESITVENQPESASEKSGNTIRFEYGDHLEGFVKLAIFEGNGETEAVMIYNKMCFVPSKVIAPPTTIRVGVYGVKAPNTKTPISWSGEIDVSACEPDTTTGGLTLLERIAAYCGDPDSLDTENRTLSGASKEIHGKARGYNNVKGNNG